MPVGLFASTEDHTSDQIRNRRVNERTGHEVDSEDIVKGFELSEGESVVVEPDELDQIEPVYFDRTDYIAPRGKEYTKVYELLTPWPKRTRPGSL